MLDELQARLVGLDPIWQILYREVLQMLTSFLLLLLLLITFCLSRTRSVIFLVQPENRVKQKQSGSLLDRMIVEYLIKTASVGYSSYCAYCFQQYC